MCFTSASWRRDLLCTSTTPPGATNTKTVDTGIPLYFLEIHYLPCKEVPVAEVATQGCWGFPDPHPSWGGCNHFGEWPLFAGHPSTLCLCNTWLWAHSVFPSYSASIFSVPTMRTIAFVKAKKRGGSMICWQDIKIGLKYLILKWVFGL